jgi:signal transduction histidine kinase
MVPTFVQYAGEVTGLLPFSRMQHYTGAGRAAASLRVVQIPKSDFPEMLQRIPALGQRLVSVMADRVREATRMQEQREKMSALGTLAAGLAHELNNPAAAVRRDAEALQIRVASMASLAADLCATGLDGPALAALGMVVGSIGQRPPVALDAMGRSRLEDTIGTWLEERDVANAWELAGTLVDAGVVESDLTALSGQLSPATLPGALRWIEVLLDSTRLAHDLRAASARISELVHSVKIYSHMDRATEKEAVAVTEGLDSTLVMLGHKLKKKGLRLEREYAGDLPKIAAYAGELNQVWTNLLDNAIDAGPEGSVIRVEAMRNGVTSVAVRVIDQGPGVPADIQAKIFEPFFTTKPVGQGTGLGLDIVERIVVQQHGGSVDLDSQPGRTVFTVRLPVA